MAEDKVCVSELLVVEAAHKLEQEGAVGVIQPLHSGWNNRSIHSWKICTPYSNNRISQVNATNH
jgi:hypothetical protein